MDIPPDLSGRRLLMSLTVVAALGGALSASAQERLYFSAVDDVGAELVARINAETVRIDMAAWYLTDRAISTALVNRFRAGVDVRLIGDRSSIFEIDPLTKDEFYWLASQGVPIRLRYNPDWFPEIVHWKATIFVGQGIVSFGSANYTPFELRPASRGNYKDESVLFTDDPELVAAFKSRFDRMWNDQVPEPESIRSQPPYFRNWDAACVAEASCGDYRARFPNRIPMVVDTRRLEGDAPAPPDLIWGQGQFFNDRLAREIAAERTRVDIVVYRLSIDKITQALIDKHRSGVPVRVIIEPDEYTNRKWPEFWLTHANVDRLWAAGIRIRRRRHVGLTHMKMLVTSRYATNASSNFTANWQRDHNYFVPATTKPAIHRAMAERFDQMWADAAGFGDFRPGLPDAPVLLRPVTGTTGIPADAVLEWRAAPFATAYDVYIGSSPDRLALAASVPARLVDNPPATYSFRASLHGGTTYYWRVVSRTNATSADPSIVNASPVRTFATVQLSVRWLASDGGVRTEVGVPVTLSASANGASGRVEYKFWILSERTGRWTVIRDYGTSPRANWTPAEPGAYHAQVWVRQTGRDAAYDDWQSLGPFTVAAVEVASLTPDAASPVPPGTPVTWTAVAQGRAALEYQFWLYRVETRRWTVLRDYSPLASATWTPSEAGTYSLQVWARRRGSTIRWEAWKSSGTFRVSSPADNSPRIAAARADAPSPVLEGTPVTLQATAYGGTRLHYKFLLYDLLRNSWTVLRDYAASPRATWTPGRAGTYSFQVWVRSTGSPADYDAWRSFGQVEVTGEAAAITSFAAGATDVARGTGISFQAAGTSPGATLQY
nr:hypothetical protein [Acidobacteriota bacterium]